MRSNHGVLIPEGESTGDHDVAAANAAAAKMADELGVSSSYRQSSERQLSDSFLTSPPSSGLSRGRNFNENGGQSQRRFTAPKLLSRRSSSSTMEDSKEEPSSMYQVMPTEGSVPPRTAPEKIKSQPPPTTGGTGRRNRTIRSPSAIIVPYTPPDLISPGGTRQRVVGQSSSKDVDDLVSVQSGVEPCLFDANGNRAPYREGPYECHHTFDGRLVKKRWCT
jgi:hypothetical protein